MTETERERVESVAPWLVFLSQHLPEVHTFDGIPAIGCMCGATRTLYVGHLARLLADRTADRTAADTARLAAVEALADEWRLTGFPDEATADQMRRDLTAALTPEATP